MLKTPDGKSKEAKLSGRRASLGRARDNTIQINDNAVSRHHAELVFESGHWLARDLGSRNGIILNGMRISEHPLADGDTLIIGETRIVFEQLPEAEDPLGWTALKGLEIAWPLESGPMPDDERFRTHALMHRPLDAEPLIPDQEHLAKMQRPDLVHRIVLFDKLHSVFLASADEGRFWTELLEIFKEVTGERWAAVLLPPDTRAGASRGALRLWCSGEGHDEALVPRTLIETSLRSGEAVLWSARAADLDSVPLKAFVCIPWRAGPDVCGALIGPASRHTPVESAPTLALMCGICSELGRWWPAISARWTPGTPLRPIPPPF